MGKKRDTEKDSALKRLVAVLINVLNRKKREASGTRDEFRYNINTKHYNYIFEAHEKDDEYYALGLTTEDTTFGTKNMPLTHNPQKSKIEPSHIRNGEIVAGHKAFSKKVEKNINFDSEDIPNVKAKKRNAKKKILTKKREQKKK